MKTHENEVLLVQHKDGKIVPTPDYDRLCRWLNVGFGTPAHAEALQAQVLRQAAAL